MLGCLTATWLGFPWVETVAAEKGSPITSVFTADELGGGIPVETMVQDSAGVLHVGGAAGLLHYDGQRWFFHGMGKSRNLRGLAFDDSEKKLWAGSRGELGWFEKNEAGTWKYNSLLTLLPAEHRRVGRIWFTFAQGNGAVFVSEDKVFRWDGKAFQVWSMPGTLRIMAMKVDGKIYLHHGLTGLYELGADGPVKIIPHEISGDVVAAWMERDGEGWLMATNHGLYRYHDNRLWPFAPEASAYMVRENFTRALRLPDGRLALGTARGGLLLMRPDGSVDTILERDRGLPDVGVNEMFLDREGGLWVASRTRLYRLSLDSPSTLFGAASGLNAYQTEKIIRHDGRIVAATDNGMYALSPENNQFAPLPGMRKGPVNMLSTADGLLFTGTYVGLWKDGRIQTVQNPVRRPTIILPSRTMPGSILVAAGAEIFALKDGKSRVVVENVPDLVQSLAEDAEGRLWITTSLEGVWVARLDPNLPVEATAPPAALKLPSSKGLSRVFATDDGRLFVFGSEGASMLLPRAERFGPVERFPVRGVRAVSYVPEQKSIWLIQNAQVGGARGLVSRINLKDGGASWEPHTVEGLWNIGRMETIFAEAAGEGKTTLWIGGAGGVLRHEVAGELVTPTPSTPWLRAYAGAEATSVTAIRKPLPYLTNSVRFDYSVPEFSRRDALMFETYIEGVDDQWVPSDASARRELTAPRDGHYTFKVRAVAETGVKSDVTEFKFEVLPPWWRTIPAMLGVVLALLPAGYGLLRLRLRALKRRTVELEEKVRVRTEELARASAAKTEFVANMSHDIRNPLNGIVGLALALDDTRLDPRQREIVSTLRECTGYLSTLVDDVLDFAQIEAGKVELRPEPFVAEELLHSVVTTLRSDAAEVGATLAVETDAELPRTLVGDAGRIQQILVNYVGNALKYSGGRIRLSVRLAPDTADEVEFAVTDDGPGITEEEQAVLFTKFARLEGARREGIAGTGLGLAACRSLADLMGGSVGVESKVGAGARFYLRLPLTVATEAVVTGDPGALLPKATVLVVEDADYNAWAAAAVLAKLGLPHSRARTGTEALEMIANQRFDVVLLDRNLPDMDGTEVAKRIRALEGEGPRAILLAVTAYCTAADKALCLASGMDAFVGKPLTPHKLRRVLLDAGRRLLAASSVQVASEVTAAQVDLALLRYLSDGSEKGLEEQIGRFLAVLAEADTALARASDRRDFATLGAVAHQVLSQAKMVGSASLEETAALLEKAAGENDDRAWNELLRRVGEEMETLRGALLGRKTTAV